IPVMPPILAAPEIVTSNAFDTVTNVAAGSFYSFFLKADGSLWAMGWNGFGQLGDGTFNTATAPEQIISTGVTAVASGRFYNPAGTLHGHSLILKSGRSLWAMGYNGSGQLGDGTYNTTNAPEQIVSEGVITIAAGGIHSLFIKSGGSLWAMGANTFGQLGDGSFNNTNRPEEIISNGVVAIAAGGAHSLFIKSDGSLWAMGADVVGQLGDGAFTGSKTNLPELIVSNGVVTVAAGNSHSLFLKSDGSLWAMGRNGSGQLGDGTLINTNKPEEIVSNGVVAIAAGDSFSLFLKSDGSLWAMGDNRSGQLGDGTLNNTNRPEEIVSGGVLAIAAGYAHSLFVKSDGSLWDMGANNYSQLGNGSGGSSVPEQLIGGVGDVSIQGTCRFGGIYYLLASTNAAQPISQWSPVWHDSIITRGTNNFSATLAESTNSSAGRQFYILRSQ
ncbi:MAG TPA: hypothetical protein VFF11_13460, partial [Candidatus Binatia bacterium]|nr:hypothetical protein [Candidatus Binatia bacterium]